MKKLLLFPIGICLLNILSFSVFADGENKTTRFVATTGTDLGDCSDRAKPCATIDYALTTTAKNEPILIAGGSYSLNENELAQLLSGKVPMKPGYTTRDLFNTKSTELHPVTFHGVPSTLVEAVEKKGFRAITDSKAINRLDRLQMETFAKSHAQIAKTNQPATECVAGMAGNFPCHNIDLLSQLTLSSFSSSPNDGSDIWGHVDLNNNREYALMGLVNGTAIIDITDAENPAEVGVIQGANSNWRDIKVYQYLENGSYKAYAYVTNEETGGLQVIDLNDLPNSVSLATSITSDFVSAHNIYISNVDYSTNTALAGSTPYIYIAGAGTGTNRLNSGAFRIFSLDNPAQPQLITTPPTGTGYVHDASSMIITDSRTAQCSNNHNPCEVFIDFNETTVDLWDMTNKANPFRISTTPYAGAAYTHSGWYSQDQNFVFIQDEKDEQGNAGTTDDKNTELRVLDISNLEVPSVVGSYIGPTKAIDHNGFTKGDMYFMSNYRRGLTILDVSTPSTPVEFGFFDTYPSPAANTASFDGAWGTYPYLPSGNILVSDSTNGLFVLKITNEPVEFAGSIGFSENSLSVNENSGSIDISVSRSNGSAGEVSVDYTTVNNSAVAGSDFEAASGTLTWVDDDTTDKIITVNLIDDSDEEGNENFSIQLSNLSNGTIETSSVVIVINANDSPTPPPASSSSGGGSIGFGLLGLLFGIRLRRHYLLSNK